MTISSYDSSSISTLFSSLGNSAGSDLLGINYSDYACIKNGSYGKLMRSYYALNSDSTSSKSSSVSKASSTSTSKDTTKTLAAIEEDAQSLTDSAKALYSRTDNKVFSKDSKGNYDTDLIYDKVSDFVEDYNSLVSSSAKSSSGSIGNAVSVMTSLTGSKSDTLEKVGITYNSKTGTLSIDEESFKSADMDQVKSLFNGTGSYAYAVATQSSMVDSYAQAEAAKSNTYGSSGKYTYNYNSGSIFYDGF